MAQAKGSFVRWQATTIAQLGYSVGLILSFAGASLGFALSVVKDKGYSPGGCWGKVFMLMSGVLLLASIGLGLWCVLTRLTDFRKTESIARDREGGNVPVADLDRRRAETDRLGKRTWKLFHWQIGTFTCGIASLVVAFGIAYHSKLF